MSEDQLGPALVRCPICDADDVGSRLDLQFNPHVRLMRCGRCAAGFASRMPTAAALEAYYASYYDVPKYEDLAESNVHFSMPQRLARHIFRRIKIQRNTVTTLRLFDFGGGDGTVAIFIAQQILAEGRADRVEITLVDYASPRRAHDSRISISQVSDANSLEEEGFDIGIASASLEHVTDLRGSLLRLLKAIHPGGSCYVRTPYVEPLIRLSRAIGMNIDFGYPNHLYDLGEAFWRSILATMDLAPRYTVHSSRPSIVESTLGSAPFRTIAAYLLKAPWWLIGASYGLVGGWEAVITCRSQNTGGDEAA